MNPSGNITKSARAEDIERRWLVVDAKGQTLGRLATQIATLLRGKHKALFTPHVDCGDFVVVINAEHVEVSEKRAEKKEYYHYTGYLGGARFRSYKNLKKDNPAEIVELAVRRMLPKNRLGKVIFKKLKVYAGAEHPHQAQRPESYALPYAK